jgi:hypothetical protein
VTAGRAFGESLKRHRELRGIPLGVVAASTKISPAFLAALERGDCSKWPGGIYSRSWIRAYAAAVGLDPDEVGARFNRSFAANAFPDREPEPIAPPKPDGIRQVCPLRLALERDPRERARLLQRRALFLTADLLLALAAAVTASLLMPVEFWKVLAGAVVACHAVGLFGGGGSATGWMERRVRKHSRPHDEHVGAVAEAA